MTGLPPADVAVIQAPDQRGVVGGKTRVTGLTHARESMRAFCGVVVRNSSNSAASRLAALLRGSGVSPSHSAETRLAFDRRDV